MLIDSVSGCVHAGLVWPWETSGLKDRCAQRVRPVRDCCPLDGMEPDGGEGKEVPRKDQDIPSGQRWVTMFIFN